jgi:uncharacterized protein (DUF58 family)
MLLGIMGASGIFGKRNISRVEVTFGFPLEVYAKQPFTLAVHLRNTRKALPLFLGRVLIDAVPALFPFIDKRGESTAYAPFSFPSRGMQNIGDVYLESSFPFSFFIRAARLKAPQSVLVFPQPKECALDGIWGEVKGATGRSSANGLGDSTELASIREYAGGDPFKSVNWKATARSGGLKTNLFEALSRRPALIDFDRIPIPDVEERISAVAFAIIDLMNRNIPVGLRLGGRSFSPALSDSHRFSMMKELALYDQTR